MTMKKILFALLTGWMAISFTACDDFLTETPSTSVPTEEALVTTQDFQNALNGVYYTLGSYRFLGRDVLAIGDAPTDITSHSVATSHFYDIFRYQILDTNSYIEEIWAYGYWAIDRCARIIKEGTSFKEVTKGDLAEVEGCIAQAYAIKALCSFYLTNMFGLPYSEANKTTLGIVNITEPVPAYSQVSRVSVEQNYSLILDDITKAKEYYAKEGVENVGKQYMNTAAVAALEARVKLYMKNYEGAITAAQEAITLSGGTIVSTKEDYKNMYTTLAVSTEDIFFIAKAEDDYLSANALNTLWNKYGLSINSATIAEYSSNDIRLALLGGTWTGGKMRGITTNNQISNLPVFRLPEMYLIQAEAYAKQSTPNYGKAKEKLLEVASKRNPDLDDNEIAEDQTVIDAIDKERKLELVQEGHRFFDARRLGKIISVADGSYTNFNIAKFVYPIPSFEVNSGFGVIQTEGWSDNLPR